MDLNHCLDDSLLSFLETRRPTVGSLLSVGHFCVLSELCDLVPEPNWIKDLARTD